jgi:ABC-type branched-subunit amino acid transport system substrate-binding protein
MPLSTIHRLSPCFPQPRARWRALCSILLVSFGLFSCRLPESEISIVKIGLVAPFEGSYRDIGYDAIYAARLAVREINESRGMEPWRLELIAYDDRGSAEMAAQAARNLVTDPSVIAVIGHYRPETTDAAAPIYAVAGLPFITLGGWGAPAGTTWHLMPAPETLVAAMLRFGQGDEVGAPVVWDSAKDARVVDTDAVLVLSLLPPIPAGERLAEWREAGWAGDVVGDVNFAASAFRTLAGAAAMEAVFVTPYPFPEHIPHTADWIGAYQAVGPHVPAPGVYALPTYEAVYLVADALAATPGGRARGSRWTGLPSITQEAVARSLGQVERSGWLGTIAWDEQHSWRDVPLYGYRWTMQGPERVELFGVQGGPLP